MSKTAPRLEAIEDPSQLHGLDDDQLALLGNEIREKIIQTVSETGGHLAPSLGVVELTLALLAEFDLSSDKLIWDVGHQAYAHKLLTGRAKVFHTLRQMGGISGFPRPEESRFDHFGVGHSSTSISAALGMAMGRDLRGLNHHIIAVIGDGSLTAGEAFEGLNLAGHMGRRLIVVLNDNEMSISPNVGAISLFLSRALSSKWLRQTRREALKFLRGIPRIGQKLALYAMRGEWSFKSFFTPGMLFEAFRFTYIGPVNGHDITSLRKHLRRAAMVDDGPVLVHVRTRKGKGYPPAENNPTLYHSIARFSPATGKAIKKSDQPTFTDVFGDTLLELAASDKRITAITAAMPEGTGTDKFRAKYPDRFIDTGICEQHAVTFAAGLASQGYRPVLAIYSTFLQRAYDQIVHDVCLQNLPVIFCIDRAGLVGEDGPTHHGAFDIAYLRHIPNIRILAPRDNAMLRKCMMAAVKQSGPCAIRYPRGSGITPPDDIMATDITEGTGQVLLDGDDLAIIAAGSSAHAAMEAARRISQSRGASILVFDPVWLKPLPEKQLGELASRFKSILVIEEGSVAGGFSSAVLEMFADKGLLDGHNIRRIGLADNFYPHGTQQQLRDMAQLGPDGICRVLEEMLS